MKRHFRGRPGFTLVEMLVTLFLLGMVFAGAFMLVSLTSDILAQVSSLVQFKNDAYRAREYISREVRESTLVQISGELGQDMLVNHPGGRVARFYFSPGDDNDYTTLKDNELLYWHDLNSPAPPRVLARYVSRNGSHVFVTRINPQDDVSGTLPISDP